MTADVAQRGADARPPARTSRTRTSTERSLRRRRLPSKFRLRTGWPLVVLFVAYPLWWVAGFGVLVFLLAAVPMALYLFRRRSILVPRGFGLWLLFLVWAAAGAATLWIDVPGALPAEGIDRLLPYAYRLAWYLTATIFLLYMGNTTEKELPTIRVARLLSVLFIITVAGGYLGWFYAELDFRSALERILPAGITGNNFVYLLIHPVTAQVHEFLGYASPRPAAPYTFANDWGANFGLLLPFFLLAWAGQTAGWRRRVFPVVLLLAVPPVIFSLNRGLWFGIIAMAAYAAIRLALRGRLGALFGLGCVAVLAALVLAFSPLGDLLQGRLDNPHSNDGRSELSSRAASAAAEASPIVGFGSTRPVEGNFFSIGGGASPLCPDCSPPQLGTQGHLWFLIFAHGFLGAFFFLAFVYFRFARSLRDSSYEAIALTSCGVFFGIVMLVYDLINPPLAIIMITLGLLWRRERLIQTNRASPSLPPTKVKVST